MLIDNNLHFHNYNCKYDSIDYSKVLNCINSSIFERQQYKTLYLDISEFNNFVPGTINTLSFDDSDILILNLNLSKYIDIINEVNDSPHFCMFEFDDISYEKKITITNNIVITNYCSNKNTNIVRNAVKDVMNYIEVQEGCNINLLGVEFENVFNIHKYNNYRFNDVKINNLKYTIDQDLSYIKCNTFGITINKNKSGKVKMMEISLPYIGENTTNNSNLVHSIIDTIAYRKLIHLRKIHAHGYYLDFEGPFKLQSKDTDFTITDNPLFSINIGKHNNVKLGITNPIYSKY